MTTPLAGAAAVQNDGLQAAPLAENVKCYQVGRFHWTSNYLPGVWQTKPENGTQKDFNKDLGTTHSVKAPTSIGHLEDHSVKFLFRAP
jgi:hypothetical protein